MKLVEKTREGSKVHRRHDRPKTPYQRLIEDPRLNEDAKTPLAAEHEHIDIVELTLGLQEALAKLNDLATHYPTRPPQRSGSALQGG